jgi:chemotaxis protein MotB
MRRWTSDPKHSSTLTALLLASLATACGYSRQEWEQQLRESDATRTQLGTEMSTRQACEANVVVARQEAEALRAQLREQGVDVDHLASSAKMSQVALEEYRLRGEQLDQYRLHYVTLQDGLKAMKADGVTVAVRGNRLLVSVPSALLFGAGEAQLSTKGEATLRGISRVFLEDSGLAGRSFQVAAHVDGALLKGSAAKDPLTLSALQARAVVAWLTAPTSPAGGGLAAARWVAVAFGASRPATMGVGDDAASRNRRIEIIMQPEGDEMLNLESLAR